MCNHLAPGDQCTQGLNMNHLNQIELHPFTVGTTVLTDTKGTGLNQHDWFGGGSLMVWMEKVLQALYVPAGTHQERKPRPM